MIWRILSITKIHFPHDYNTTLYFPVKMCGKPVACKKGLNVFLNGLRITYWDQWQQQQQRKWQKNTQRKLNVVSKCTPLLLPSCCSFLLWECFEIKPLQFLFTEALRSRSGDRGWESRANLQWQRGSDQPVRCLFPLAVPCSSPALT